MKRYKFDGQWKYSEIFYDIVRDEILKYNHLREFDEIIPVPLSKERLRERGYNQSALIAELIGRDLSVPMNENALKRVRHTRRQSELKKYERINNVKNAFKVSESVKDKRIILFDDLYTTGNTMKECAKILKGEGAKEVIGLSLCITEIHKSKSIYF